MTPPETAEQSAAAPAACPNIEPTLENAAEKRRRAPRPDPESELALIEYLCLITGEGTREPERESFRRPHAGGPKDWTMEWDLELGNWEFRRRTPAAGEPGRRLGESDP